MGRRRKRDSLLVQLNDLIIYGDISSVEQFLHDHPNIRLNNIEKWTFRDVCLNSDLEMAKLLYESNPSFYDDLTLEDKEYLFKRMCKRKGRYPLVKWLYELNPNVYHHLTLEAKRSLFVDACEYNAFETMKWLYELNPNAYYSLSEWYKGYLFRYSCEYGSLEQAKWLLQIDPTLKSVNLDYEFKQNCEQNAVAQAELIQALSPYLYVIYYGEHGDIVDYHIRTEEEVKWERRKYLIWLASDESPNKQCLLYQLPSDISRQIIQYV